MTLIQLLGLPFRSSGKYHGPTEPDFESEKQQRRSRFILQHKKDKDHVNNKSAQVQSGQSKELEVVSSFNFLGFLITENGDCKEDIRKRLALGRAAVVGLNKIWKGNNMRIETKVRLMEALVFPVATYGAETWTFRKANIKKSFREPVLAKNAEDFID